MIAALPASAWARTGLVWSLLLAAILPAVDAEADYRAALAAPSGQREPALVAAAQAGSVAAAAAMIENLALDDLAVVDPRWQAVAAWRDLDEPVRGMQPRHVHALVRLAWSREQGALLGAAGQADVAAEVRSTLQDQPPEHPILRWYLADLIAQAPEPDRDAVTALMADLSADLLALAERRQETDPVTAAVICYVAAGRLQGEERRTAYHRCEAMAARGRDDNLRSQALLRMAWSFLDEAGDPERAEALADLALEIAVLDSIRDRAHAVLALAIDPARGDPVDDTDRAPYQRAAHHLQMARRADLPAAIRQRILRRTVDFHADEENPEAFGFVAVTAIQDLIPKVADEAERDHLLTIHDRLIDARHPDSGAQPMAEGLLWRTAQGIDHPLGQRIAVKAAIIGIIESWPPADVLDTDLLPAVLDHLAAAPLFDGHAAEIDAMRARRMARIANLAAEAGDPEMAAARWELAADLLLASNPAVALEMLDRAARGLIEAKPAPGRAELAAQLWSRQAKLGTEAEIKGQARAAWTQAGWAFLRAGIEQRGDVEDEANERRVAELALHSEACFQNAGAAGPESGLWRATFLAATAHLNIEDVAEGHRYAALTLAHCPKGGLDEASGLLALGLAMARDDDADPAEVAPVKRAILRLCDRVGGPHAASLRERAESLLP